MDKVNYSKLFKAKDDGLEMICKILMRIKEYLGNDWKKSRILYRGVSKDYTSNENKKKWTRYKNRGTLISSNMYYGYKRNVG